MSTTSTSTPHISIPKSTLSGIYKKMQAMQKSYEELDHMMAQIEELQGKSIKTSRKIWHMTWDISYTPTFRRNFRRLPRHIQAGFFESFDIFQEDIHHPTLSTHALRGSMSGLYSSHIDDSYRFITRIDSERQKILLFNIGDHSIYQP